MTHEKFKAFKIYNGSIFDGHLDELLNGSFTLRSLSLTEIFQTNELLVSIGYEDTAAGHKYQVISKKIGPYSLSDMDIEEKLEDLASGLEGIICQDITNINDELVVTFLLIKK